MYNHNDILIVINSDNGFRWREAYILKERMNGCKWERFTTNYGSYAAGYDRPRYPVPAIRYIVSINPCNVFYYENEKGSELIHMFAETTHKGSVWQ